MTTLVVAVAPPTTLLGRWHPLLLTMGALMSVEGTSEWVGRLCQYFAVVYQRACSVAQPWSLMVTVQHHRSMVIKACIQIGRILSHYYFSLLD
jgi:hypothetical protein